MTHKRISLHQRDSEAQTRLLTTEVESRCDLAQGIVLPKSNIFQSERFSIIRQFICLIGLSIRSRTNNISWNCSFCCHIFFPLGAPCICSANQKSKLVFYLHVKQFEQLWRLLFLIVLPKSSSSYNLSYKYPLAWPEVLMPSFPNIAPLLQSCDLRLSFKPTYWAMRQAIDFGLPQI